MMSPKAQALKNRLHRGLDAVGTIGGEPINSPAPLPGKAASKKENEADSDLAPESDSDKFQEAMMQEHAGGPPMGLRDKVRGKIHSRMKK